MAAIKNGKALDTKDMVILICLSKNPNSSVSDIQKNLRYTYSFDSIHERLTNLSNGGFVLESRSGANIGLDTVWSKSYSISEKGKNELRSGKARLLSEGVLAGVRRVS